MITWRVPPFTPGVCHPHEDGEAHLAPPTVSWGHLIRLLTRCYSPQHLKLARRFRLTGLVPKSGDQSRHVRLFRDLLSSVTPQILLAKRGFSPDDKSEALHSTEAEDLRRGFRNSECNSQWKNTLVAKICTRISVLLKA